MWFMFLRAFSAFFALTIPSIASENLFNEPAGNPSSLVEFFGEEQMHAEKKTPTLSTANIESNDVGRNISLTNYRVSSVKKPKRVTFALPETSSEEKQKPLKPYKGSSTLRSKQILNGSIPAPDPLSTASDQEGEYHPPRPHSRLEIGRPPHLSIQYNGTPQNPSGQLIQSGLPKENPILFTAQQY